MVGQQQPESHVKCEDQSSPEARSKQCGRQDPSKPVVLSTPGRREEGLGLLASEPPPSSLTGPLPSLIFSHWPSGSFVKEAGSSLSTLLLPGLWGPQASKITRCLISGISTKRTLFPPDISYSLSTVLKCGPWISSISCTWELAGNADSWASPRPSKTESVGVGCNNQCWGF